MPKVNIREIDNTRAGDTEYANFSVVVPGFCGNTTIEDGVFDDNGIYEVKSQTEFVEKIGKIAGTAGAMDRSFAHGETWEGNSKEFYESDKAGHIYIVGNETTPSATEGHLILEENSEEGSGEEEENTYFKLTKANTWEEAVASARCVYIRPGHEGNDAINVANMGNQIAYELLGLGYTVLYKQIKLGNDESINVLKNPAFWECLKDRASYDFRYICAGGSCHEDIYKAMMSVVKYINRNAEDNGRGDCFALLDINESALPKQQKPELEIKAQVALWTDFLGVDGAGKYAAIFTPQVTYKGKGDSEYNNNMTFPASFHYLACAATAFDRYAEWYAVAGYNRGYSDFVIDHTSYKLGEIASNVLMPRPNNDADITELLPFAVNPITCIRGNYYLWGNRTAHNLALRDPDGNLGLRASHFLNVRQLCCTLKKDIYKACKELTFDPNSDILWVNFCNKVRPTLEKMKGDQGISDYKFIKVKTTEKATMKAKIKIVPIVAAEDFYIDLYLEDSISGMTVEATENE